MTFTAVKDPDAVLDYRINWEQVMESSDPVDSITGSSWVVDEGLVLDSNSFSAIETVAWLSGGTLKKLAKAENIITTAGGRTHVRTINISIKDT